MQLPLPLAELTLPVEGAFPQRSASRIFCNRSLRLDQVEMVGFDMDYTLAIYHQAQMDRLSIEATASKLVERGYPPRLRHMQYRTDFPIRGLLIDRKLGNVLKMDRYRYVKKAYHGMREIDRDERRQLYHRRRLRPGTRRYHWVDTLYALSEVSVYAAAIETLETNGTKVDYHQLFQDVRDCIDESHRDGSILDQILADPPRFVRRDPDLGPMFHRLRSAGKRLFLLTNSYPAYTDRMMSYLVGDSMAEYPSWRNYFDVIVTAAAKPKFFAETPPFEQVQPDGSTRPLERRAFERAAVYVGGNIKTFEEITGVSGDRVLYVGDHIYGDVLRAKKESAWRTAMIIQELDEELEALDRSRSDIERGDALEQMRARLLDDLRERQHRLKRVQRRLDAMAEHDEGRPALDAARVRHRRAIDRLRVRLKAVDAEHEQLEARVDAAFHPFWGSLMKAGAEVSSFGDQVEAYACLYTTRASNFLHYSPMHYFRSPRDRMPHELDPVEL